MDQRQMPSNGEARSRRADERRAPAISGLRLALTGQAVDLIAGRGFGFVGPITELHQVRVFGRVFVEVTQHVDGPETLRAEENLGIEVRLANFQHNARAALGGKLADQLAGHLTPDALP